MNQTLGIYIHIPFCEKKCGYCDFYSVTNLDWIDAYVNRLVEEIQSDSNNETYLIDTIFFGGGTPSILNGAQIEKILDTLKQKYRMSNELEITIECNPGTVNHEKLQAYKDLGVNRLSYGVQAFQEKHLMTMGRIHTFEDMADNFQISRDIGFDNINLDLIFGLPYQTMNDLKETLDAFTGLEPEHLSVYALTIEANTPFGKISDEIHDFEANEDIYAAMYALIQAYLIEKGYEQYEVSNFAKKGFHSRHNLKYWEQNPFIGFGVGAASYINHKRYKNKKDLKGYLAHIPFSEMIDDHQVLSIQDEMDEFMYLGLRKSQGVDDKDFEKLFHDTFYDVYHDQIQKLLSKGYLKREDSRIWIPAQYFFVNNSILAEFLSE